jgi:hypothetical protein
LWLCAGSRPQTYAQQGFAGIALPATLSHSKSHVFNLLIFNIFMLIKEKTQENQMTTEWGITELPEY